MQQFSQLLPNAFNQPGTGNIYEAFAQDQGLAGKVDGIYSLMVIL